MLKRVWRIRADFWQGLKSKEERVSQSEGSKHTKAGVERGQGALRELNIPGRKQSLEPVKSYTRVSTRQRMVSPMCQGFRNYPSITVPRRKRTDPV